MILVEGSRMLIHGLKVQVDCSRILIYGFRVAP